MARHVLAILSAVHGAGRAHGALHPTTVEVEYEGSERVRLKVLPTCLLCFSWEGGRRRRLGGSPFGCGGGTPQPGTPLVGSFSVGSFSGGSFSGGSFSAEGGGTHSEGRVVLGTKEKGVAAA